jgi:hypothetical protein
MIFPLAQSMPPRPPSDLVVQTYQPYGVTFAMNAPWRYAALAQLWDLQETGQNRSGQGDLRISDTASSRARQILGYINIGELPTPMVAPISGGGVGVSWEIGNREIQLSVFSDGEVVYLKIENDRILDEPEGVLDESQYSAGLKWLLGRAA